MASRTRSRARQQAVEETQGRITDSFKASRRGPTAPGKLLAKEIKEEIVIPAIVKEEEPVKVPSVEPKKASEPAPVSQKATKKASSAKTTKKAKQEVVLPTEKVTIEAPVPPVLESPPRRARKTPTPTNSPQAPKSVRRLVFAEDKAPLPEVKPSEKAPVEIPSVSNQPPAVVTPPFGLAEKKQDAKIRSSAALQARLAEKSAAMKRVHAQNAAGKSKQVSELSEVLKSPQKSIHLSPIKKASSTSHRSPSKKLAPLFASATPSKRSEAIRLANPEGSASKIPDYVLPSHKTPAKEAGSDEELEKQSKREHLEKGKTALLLDAVKKNQDIDLPPKYQSLLDKFHCCDRIVSIFTGRGSRCESKDIFKNVTKNLKKDFSKEHMAQILTVYPKSYNLRLDEQRDMSGRPIGKYDLVLDANVDNDLAQFMRAESPVKQSSEEPLPMVLPGRCLSPMKSPRKKVAPALPREAELDLRPRLEGWRMTCRKCVMHHLLAERVKKFHRRFMEKLGEKVGEVRRFHPAFVARIDKECDDIEQAALPEPAVKEKNFTDVRQFMNSVSEPTTAVDVAIKELMASSSKDEMSATRNIPLSPKKFAQMAASKPKGTKSLLERIREKEAKTKAVEATRDPAAERRHFCLELLYSKILRNVLNIFVQKGCRSMELALVVEKLEFSTKRARSELRECLELMCDVAKDVANIVEVASRKYLQIEKDKHDVVRNHVKTELDKAPKPAFPVATKAR